MPEKPTFIEIFGLIRENLGFLVDLAKDDLCKLQLIGLLRISFSGKILVWIVQLRLFLCPCRYN